MQSRRWTCDQCGSGARIWQGALAAGAQGEAIMWQHGSLVEIEFPARGKIWEGQYTDRDVLTARWGPPGVRGVWSLSGRSLTWVSGEDWPMVRSAWLCRRCRGTGHRRHDEPGVRAQLDKWISDVKQILQRGWFGPRHLPTIQQCLSRSAPLDLGELQIVVGEYLQVEQGIPIQLGDVRWAQRTEN